MNIIGRKRELKRIMNYATSEPENKAFFGVKGLGKSTLIDTVFTRENCLQFAEEYQCLFVKASLQPQRKGDDLINFLLDRVTNAIDLIADESIKSEIQGRLTLYEEKYHTKDSLLRDALETIRSYGFSLVLIMDEFHNMGRNSDVGTEQYDFLRSLNEGNLICYWIISDSDFSDVYATSQFTTSFFAQKFIPETVPQMKKEDMLLLIQEKADKEDLNLSEPLIEAIYNIIGGIPGFAVPAIKCIDELEMLEDSKFSAAIFMDYLLENPRCISLIKSWSRSLTEEQKYLLVDIARQEKVYQDEWMSSIGRINQLGDHSGLGLLIHDSDEIGKYWRVNSEIFKYFIVSKEDTFFATDITPIETVKDDASRPGTTYIQNAYFNVNNNFFNPNDAVKSLLVLKEIATCKQLPAAPTKALTDAIQCLPYEQEGWDKLTDEQKDEQTGAFADLASETFRSDILSETQLSRFSLNQQFLDGLSETCRNDLISAIQIYDFLQFCVDKFGLNILNSESARGILFARLYESMLKEYLHPALCSDNEISSRPIFLGGKRFVISTVPPFQRTIKFYANFLNDSNRDPFVENKLASICVNDINRHSNDSVWWRKHQDDMFRIGNLRNECCHSGNTFKHKDLENLLYFLFDRPQAITNIEVYNAITNRL